MRPATTVIVERLELVDFRNYAAAAFELTGGTTVVVGDNGQGKTNFAEALAYLATLGSFRGAPAEALVRVGRDVGRASGPTCATTTAASRSSRPSWCRPGATACRSTGSASAAPATCSAWCGSPSSRPTTSTLVKGGPGRAPALPRRHPRRPGRQVRRAAARARPHRAPAQHPAAPGRRSARRGRRRRRSTCGTPAWPTSASSSDGPGDAGRAARRRTSSPPTSSSPAGRPRSHWCTTRRGGATAWPRRWPRHATADVRRGVSTVGPHRDEVDAARRRHAGPHPRLAGRAAHAGAGPAPRRPPAGGRAHRVDAGARARRRAVRARRRAGDGAARAPARRAGRDHDGRRRSRRRPAPIGVMRIVAGPSRPSATGRDGRWPATGAEPGDGDDRRRSRAAHRRARRRRAVLARRAPGGPRSAACSAAGTRSSAPAMAANVRPIRLERRDAPGGGDEPAWATQVRLLSDELRGRLASVTGVQVDRVEVRVGRPSAADGPRLPPGCDTPLVDWNRIADTFVAGPPCPSRARPGTTR